MLKSDSAVLLLLFHKVCSVTKYIKKSLNVFCISHSVNSSMCLAVFLTLDTNLAPFVNVIHKRHYTCFSIYLKNVGLIWSPFSESCQLCILLTSNISSATVITLSIMLHIIISMLSLFIANVPEFL